MHLSSTIPPSPQLSRQLNYAQDLNDRELEEIFDSRTVNGLMAETNAGGFELNRCEYDREKDIFNLQLKGVTAEGRTFCGDTIHLTAKREEGKIKLLQAEVDRSYMSDDMDIDL
jgi:hypothetical protein